MHIINCFQVFREERMLVILMELGEMDFATYWSKSALSAPEIFLWWQQMLAAVKVAHNAKIVHCDLKPQNFILVRRWSPWPLLSGGAHARCPPAVPQQYMLKLSDFGVSRELDELNTHLSEEDSRGTATYMAPEMVHNSRSDGKVRFGMSVDIWSLGVILHELLHVGVRPYSHIERLRNKCRLFLAIADANAARIRTSCPRLLLLKNCSMLREECSGNAISGAGNADAGNAEDAGNVDGIGNVDDAGNADDAGSADDENADDGNVDDIGNVDDGNADDGAPLTTNTPAKIIDDSDAVLITPANRNTTAPRDTTAGDDAPALLARQLLAQAHHDVLLGLQWACLQFAAEARATTDQLVAITEVARERFFLYSPPLGSPMGGEDPERTLCNAGESNTSTSALPPGRALVLRGRGPKALDALMSRARTLAALDSPWDEGEASSRRGNQNLLVLRGSGDQRSDPDPNSLLNLQSGRSGRKTQDGILNSSSRWGGRSSPYPARWLFVGIVLASLAGLATVGIIIAFVAKVGTGKSSGQGPESLVVPGSAFLPVVPSHVPSSVTTTTTTTSEEPPAAAPKDPPPPPPPPRLSEWEPHPLSYHVRTGASTTTTEDPKAAPKDRAPTGASEGGSAATSVPASTAVKKDGLAVKFASEELRCDNEMYRAHDSRAAHGEALSTLSVERPSRVERAYAHFRKTWPATTSSLRRHTACDFLRNRPEKRTIRTKVKTKGTKTKEAGARPTRPTRTTRPTRERALVRLVSGGNFSSGPATAPQV